MQSYGGLTTVTDYHLIPRQEDVVDSTFMHDNYASPGARWVAGRCERLQMALFTLACAGWHPWGSATPCARMAYLARGVLPFESQQSQAWKLARRQVFSYWS